MQRAPYHINLETDPHNRWNHVIADNKDLLVEVEKQMGQEIKTKLGWFCYVIFPIFFRLLSWSSSWLIDGELLAEMKGISNVSGIPLYKILQLNLGYDFLARCTSIVCYDLTNVWHLRNMDWDTDILNKITIEVVFSKNGMSYGAIGWLGFVGIMTGWRDMPEPTTISLNFRKEGNSLFCNLLNYVRGNSPVSFAIRKYLETGDFDVLHNVVAPCYLTIGQSNKMRIMEIGKRYRLRCYDISNSSQKLCDNNIHDGNLVFLVQTNNDYHITSVDKKWADGDLLLLSTVERKCHAIKLLNDVGNRALTFDDCFGIMQTAPIKNEFTVYTSVMQIDRNSNRINHESEIY